MISLQNSNVSTYSKVESSLAEDDLSSNPFYREGGQSLMLSAIQHPSFKDNLMQHLTNLRFRFNDGDFLKHMAYPEVNIESQTTIKVQLMNKVYIE
jgi:hypothetical protein